MNLVLANTVHPTPRVLIRKNSSPPIDYVESRHVGLCGMEAWKDCSACDSDTDDKYVTAMSGTMSTTSKPSDHEYASVAAEMEASRVSWSELTTELSSNEEEQQHQKKRIARSNRKIFRKLVEKYNPLNTYSLSLLRQDAIGVNFVLEEKIAEGAQAEIYRAVHTESHRQLAVKVFKLEGAPLKILQHQLAEGVIRSIFGFGNCNYIRGMALLDDGRFALRMELCWGDLGKLIALRMQENRHDHPFTISKAYQIMWEIARGMLSLRAANISHRDLKSSNVLVGYMNGEDFRVYVADYECSNGVVGTRFWRAPEILRACGLKDGSVNMKNELFTEKSDVYSYGMTCYEILSGKMPFGDVPSNDYEPVYSGQVKLKWPRYISSHTKLKALLKRCCDLQPSRRPTFVEIARRMHKYRMATLY